MEKRPFTVRLSTGKIATFTTRKPTVQEQEASEQEYSAVFNRSIMGGSPTRTKLRHALTKNKMIDPADEERSTQIQFDINRIDDEIRKLSKALKDKKPEDLNDHEKGVQRQIDDLQKKREPLQREWNGLREVHNSYFTYTAESQAEVAQRNFLVVCATEYGEGNKGRETGDRVWESVDALNASTDVSAFNRSLYEYMMMVQDLPSDGDTMFGKAEDEKPEGGEGGDPTTPPADEPQKDEDRTLVMQ